MRLRQHLLAGSVAIAITALLSGCTIATVVAESRTGGVGEASNSSIDSDNNAAAVDPDASLSLACLDNSMYSRNLTGGRPIASWFDMAVNDAGDFVLTGHDAAGLLVDGGEMRITFARTAGNDDGTGDADFLFVTVGYQELAADGQFRIDHATYDGGKDMSDDADLEMTNGGFTLTMPIMDAFAALTIGPGPYVIDLTRIQVDVYASAQTGSSLRYSERTHVCNTGTIGPLDTSPAFVEEGWLACYDRTWGDGDWDVPIDTSYVSFSLKDGDITISEADARPGGGEITVFSDTTFEIEPGETISFPWIQDGVVVDVNLEVNTPSVWCMSRYRDTPLDWR